MTDQRSPADWFDDWPDGQPHPNAPRAALWAAQLAQAIDDHLAEHDEPLRELAERSGVAPATVRAVRAGARWPSLATAVALVESLR